MASKWRFFKSPEAQHALLEAPAEEFIMNLLMMSERGPGEWVSKAIIDCLDNYRQDRAKLLIEKFLTIFSDGKTLLKEAMEWQLAVLVHREMVPTHELQPVVEFCKAKGIDVIMPDPNSSVIVFM